MGKQAHAYHHSKYFYNDYNKGRFKYKSVITKRYFIDHINLEFINSLSSFNIWYPLHYRSVIKSYSNGKIKINPYSHQQDYGF